ncbi:MAG: hypothetical protein IJ558_11515 [Treponema sp.]|nr:hypothetical protein [Treponema sp.]
MHPWHGRIAPELDQSQDWITDFGGSAMSLYEKIMVAIAIITLVYDILSDLLRRRKKEDE